MRLTLKMVPSPIGNCFVITETETGKNVEVMAAQLSGMIKRGGDGSLPHGGYSVANSVVSIWHDEDREQHEVSFTYEELDQLLG